MADGGYPIRSARDVENAVRDYYRSGEKADVKAHIIARAKAIGAESALPDDWKEAADKAAGLSDAFGGRARAGRSLARPPPPSPTRPSSSIAPRPKTRACERRSMI